jgi:hypothetical protein
MLTSLKEKITNSILDWKIKGKEYQNQSFSDFFKKAFNFLVIMPEEDADFAHSMQVLDYLERNKKHVTIFILDFRVSLLPLKYRPRVVEHNMASRSPLKLQSNKTIDKLEGMSFQVIIDLNRKEDKFCTYVASVVNAPFKIGFAKENSDKVYNFQVKENVQEPEIAYKNFLECLEKFNS